VIVACKQCLQQFRTVPADHRQFCSFACFRRYKGETSIERRIRESLTRLNITFVQEHQVGRYSIDFAIFSTQTALEVDGDYWHKATKDVKRDGLLKKYGWKTVRIKQHEMDNAINLDELVKNRLLD
jgi:very-short-patch-repair endonuclease